MLYGKSCSNSERRQEVQGAGVTPSPALSAPEWRVLASLCRDWKLGETAGRPSAWEESWLSGNPITIRPAPTPTPTRPHPHPTPTRPHPHP